MTPLEQALLQLLGQQKRLAIARLAKELGQPQSAVIRAVSGLEAAGVARRDGQFVVRI